MNRRAAPHSIMIDGFNLGLEKGTGVATYARNLSYACRDIGLRTEILYGAPFSSGRRPCCGKSRSSIRTSRRTPGKRPCAICNGWCRARSAPGHLRCRSPAT